MRIPRSFHALLSIAGISFGAYTASADLEVTTSVHVRARVDFEVPLSPHGTWVEFGSYGRCWRPGHIAVGWRPYCAGEWVWTDCGWYWSSEEPWAWACYHYGYWIEDPAMGWVWVPGVEWAPAWVSWRVGGGYIGWAPLPPHGVFFAAHPRDEAFVFIGEAKFGGPIHPGTVVVKDTVVFKKTTPMGNLRAESRMVAGSTQKVMVNNGPGIERVQKTTGKSFAPVPIHIAASRAVPPAKNTRSFASSKDSETKRADNAHSDEGKDSNSDYAHGSSDHAEHSQRSGRSAGGGHGKH